MKPIIKLYDRIFAHAHTMSNGHMKLEPEYFTWYRGEEACDVAVYTDFSLSEVNSCGSKHKYNIALLIESPEVFPSPYGEIKKLEDKFDKIFTFKEDLRERSAKYIPYRLGGTWIREQDWAIYHKTKMISMIASAKTNTHGQRLRHEIKRLCHNRVDIFGKINDKHIDYKLKGLRDYRFSIVTENCTTVQYFTEKLIDCFLTGTIPIYYGSPEINLAFNERGISQFKDPEQIKSALKPGTNMFTREVYDTAIGAVAENFKIAKQYTMPENQIGLYLKSGGII